MLHHSGVIPADRMILCLGMFSYGRLVHEAFDEHVLMLLQMYFESTCSLADVHRCMALRRQNVLASPLGGVFDLEGDEGRGHPAGG